LRIWIEDYAGALGILTRVSLDPASRLVGRNALNLLNAAAGINDPARFAVIRDAVRRAHDALLLRLGLTHVEGFETPLASVDAYRSSARDANWIFVGWPKTGGMPVGLVFRVVRYEGMDEPELSARVSSCSMSSDIDLDGAGPDAPAEKILDLARKTYSNRHELRGSMWSDLPVPPARGAQLVQEEANDEASEAPTPDCTILDQVLLAFADAPQFTGGEYVEDSGTLSETQVRLMLTGSAEQQARATDYILGHPNVVDPFELVKPISTLLQRGDKLQAAFWFYFWQIRSAPWAKYGPPDGAPALRGALNATIGPSINAWIGSDPEAMREIVERVTSFERKVPLYPGRPEGVSEADWLKAVQHTRDEYAKGFRDAFPQGARARQKFAAERAKNGLRNGPLESLGAPLREEQR
jgi:hypothetical protein